jgi:hypothetical protein
METRSEKHYREAKEEHIRRMNEIVKWCVDNEVEEKQTLMVVTLSSKLCLDIEQLLWFVETSKDIDEVIESLEDEWVCRERGRVEIKGRM